MEPIRVLQPSQMEMIDDAAQEILARTGMRIESEEAMDYLAAFGCQVDRPSYRVRFPRQVTRAVLEKMRKDYARPDRPGKPLRPQRMPVRFSHVRFRSTPHQVHQDFTVSAGGFCCFLHDLTGRRRPAARKDVLCAINMVNHLANIDYTGLPVSDQSVPADHRPIVMAATLAKYTRKLGGIETFGKDDVAAMCELGRIVAGSADAFAASPVLVGYAEVRSPLCFDRNMVDIFLEYVKRGVPQTVDTMPAGGTTAPVTAAGILALGVAETLAGVILAYAVREDAVVGMDVTCSYADMSSGLYRYAGAERCSLLMARVQMLSEYYGCPAGVHGGKTDSCFYNEQAGAEKMSTMLTAVLAGAVGFGTVGHLENAVTFSPMQLVIDNEMAGYVRRVVRQPIAVDADSLAVDLIDAVGPGGEFLSQAHTAERFRDELFLSPLFASLPWGQARRDPAQADTFGRARSMARELWRPPAGPALSDDQIREVRRVVRQATGKSYAV